MRKVLTEARAEGLARAALRRVARVSSAPHPAAHGGLDRHGRAPDLWVLARLLARFPAMAPADEVQALFDRQFAATEPARRDVPPSAVDQSLGDWAWILKLAAELRGLDDARGTGWGVALAPLAESVADRILAVLPGIGEPVRAGTEASSALALVLARDYALATRDDALLGLFWQKAVDWFGRDRDGEGREPDRDAIVAPALIEAECMRGLLPPGQWRPWFDTFLPGIAERRPATLFRPAGIGERPARGGALNLGRAWCWRGLAQGLPDADPRRPIVEEAAEAHLAAALGAVVDGEDGWPASLAVLALEA
jgi:hypothetical protein